MSLTFERIAAEDAEENWLPSRRIQAGCVAVGLDLFCSASHLSPVLVDEECGACRISDLSTFPPKFPACFVSRHGRSNYIGNIPLTFMEDVLFRAFVVKGRSRRFIACKR